VIDRAVIGLEDIPRDEWPIRASFTGLRPDGGRRCAMLAMAGWAGGLGWRRGMPDDPWFLRALVVAGLSPHRDRAGWFVTEVGPPAVDHLRLMRTRTRSPDARPGRALVLFTAVYVFLSVILGVRASPAVPRDRPKTAPVAGERTGSVAWRMSSRSSARWSLLVLYASRCADYAAECGPAGLGPQGARQREAIETRSDRSGRPITSGSSS